MGFYDNNQNELNSIPYFTRLIKVDRVGFEPTTSVSDVRRVH
jgi:hypothetical protein